MSSAIGLNVQSGLDWLSAKLKQDRFSISSLCKSIDDLTGFQGFPTGQVTEIYGESGCGKTQLWCVFKTSWLKLPFTD